MTNDAVGAHGCLTTFITKNCSSRTLCESYRGFCIHTNSPSGRFNNDPLWCHKVTLCFAGVNTTNSVTIATMQLNLTEDQLHAMYLTCRQKSKHLTIISLQRSHSCLATIMTVNRNDLEEREREREGRSCLERSHSCLATLMTANRNDLERERERAGRACLIHRLCLINEMMWLRVCRQNWNLYWPKLKPISVFD